jgi:subtilisin family serine protease
VLSGAVALGFVSVANAAALEAGRTIDTISLDFSNAFAPTQFDRDGNVYGVRASVRGRGSEGVLTSHYKPQATITPGACPGGGGWCDTPHNIAAKTVGWDFHVTGAGVTIGIVDSGIDLNNQEFAGRVLTGTCFKWSSNPCTSHWEQIGGDVGVSPKNTTHGTHVAGIAAGANVGIAPGASILPVKVCSSTSTGCNRVNDGIAYAATHGADVINVSIGGPLLDSSDVGALVDAVNATPNGVLLVVSAGNSGFKDPTGGYLAGAALRDGVRGRMLVVGAAGCNGDASGNNCANSGLGGPSTFGQMPSSRCEIHGGVSYCMRDFFVMAPGVDIWSSVGNSKKGKSNYGYLSGTSMAAPFVTGVAALVKSQNLSMTADDVAQIILSTADDLGAPGHDPIFGAGMVDVSRALAPISLTSAGSRAAAVPVAGANIAGATRTRSNALTSVMSGPLTGALTQSALLKKVIVVDSYGRPYTTDLTRAVDNRAFGLTNILFTDRFMGFSPFAMAVDSPMGGQLQISGLGVRSTTPALLSGNYLAADRNDYQVRDLLIDAPITERIGFNLGYRVDSTAGLFNNYDANSSAAYNGLFIAASGVNSPYASLTDGGSFLGTTLKLADDLHFSMTQSLLTPERDQFTVNRYSMVSQLMGPAPLMDQRNAGATVASLNWDAAKWAGIGLTASQTSERNGMLGGLTTAALSLADTTKTTAVGVSARVGFGDGWVTTASYAEGLTHLDLKPTNIITSASDLRSRSYGVAVAKHGLFGQSDSLGLAVSRPIQIYSGSANLTAATGLDTKSGLLTYGTENLSLATRTPETDVELGYVTTFLDGALALQTNAAYQMNLSGQNGKNALAVVSRAKINF